MILSHHKHRTLEKIKELDIYHIISIFVIDISRHLCHIYIKLFPSGLLKLLTNVSAKLNILSFLSVN